MDSICKEINAEDVGAMTLCGWLAAMDSTPTPNATSPMQLTSDATSLMQLLRCNFSDATSPMQLLRVTFICGVAVLSKNNDN